MEHIKLDLNVWYGQRYLLVWKHIKLDLNVWYGQRYLLVWNTLN